MTGVVLLCIIGPRRWSLNASCETGNPDEPQCHSSNLQQLRLTAMEFPNPRMTGQSAFLFLHGDSTMGYVSIQSVLFWLHTVDRTEVATDLIRWICQTQLYFRFVKRPGESHLALDGKKIPRMTGPRWWIAPLCFHTCGEILTQWWFLRSTRYSCQCGNFLFRI